jgi:hypothetical protein
MTAQQPQRRPHSWHQPRPHPRSPDDVHDAIPEADPENASADAPSPPKPKLAVVPYNTSLIEVLRQPVESALDADIAGAVDGGQVDGDEGGGVVLPFG